MCLAAFVGALLAATALVAWKWGQEKYSQASEAFVVKKIEVLNDGMLSRQRILGFAEVSENANLLSLDLLHIQNRLEKLTFIEKASVERELPNILKIRVWERRPELVWNKRPEKPIPRDFFSLSRQEQKQIIQSLLFVDQEGFALNAPIEWYLPHGPVHKCLEIIDANENWLIPGKITSEPLIKRALDLKRFLDRNPTVLNIQVNRISFSEPRTLQVIDNQGGKVVFSKDHLELSLMQWMRVAEVGRLSGKRIQFMDLTITNNCPVIWEDLPDVASMKQ